METSLHILAILFLIYFMFSFPAVLLVYFPKQLDNLAKKRELKRRNRKDDV